MVASSGVTKKRGPKITPLCIPLCITATAALAGLFLSSIGEKTPEPVISWLNNFKGAYCALGLLVIGIGLSGTKPADPKSSRSPSWSALDWSLLVALLGWRHIVSPLIGILLLLVLPIAENEIRVLTIVLFLPLAANVSVFATSLHLHPRTTATAVAISIAFSLIFIPLTITWSDILL